MLEDTLSHHGERSRKLVELRERKFSDAIHTSTGRAGSGRRYELGDGGLGPRGGDFDAAVRVIAYPAREAGTARCLAHEPPKSYALNLPNDLEMNRHPSSAAGRPSQECRKHRCEYGCVGRFRRHGRNVNLAVAYALRQPTERR